MWIALAAALTVTVWIPRVAAQSGTGAASAAKKRGEKQHGEKNNVPHHRFQSHAAAREIRDEIGPSKIGGEEIEYREIGGSKIGNHEDHAGQDGCEIQQR